jgi:hypothetical protein
MMHNVTIFGNAEVSEECTTIAKAKKKSVHKKLWKATIFLLRGFILILA